MSNKTFMPDYILSGHALQYILWEGVYLGVGQFISRIKAERTKKKISQKSLAKAIGMDNSYLSRIERGERDITIGNLLKIADVLGVGAEYLLLDFVSPKDDSDYGRFWRQINKLDTEQRDTLINIVMLLTVHSEQWRSTEKAGLGFKEYDRAVNYIEIGKRIRSQRLIAKLSQEKLAELAGISASFLGSIERCEEILSIETLFKISNALHLPVSWLLVNANTDEQTLGLRDVVEGLARSDKNKDTLLLNLITVLLDNFDKW